MNRNKKKIIRSCTVPNSINFFKEIMQKMRNDGYESVVVTSPGERLDEFKEQCPEFKAITLPMARHISLKSDIVSLYRMIRVFQREKPYIVHSITPKAGLLCMVAGKMTGVPVRIHTFTGLVWPTAVGMKRKILMLTDKILCSCATHIIPEGEGVKNDLQTNITKKPMKVLGYGNIKGVDMDYFNPKRFTDVPKDNDVFTFTFVGRIVGDKGINELVEAFTKLHDKYAKTKLVLVGRYETDLDPVRELTQQRIAENDAICAIGPKYGEDLLKEYVKGDCFVMPSYREGFPNTVLEAGAMGLPQIVTDINGSREIIVNEKNGLIVPSKDAKALYNAMERVLTDKETFTRMKGNARPMIEARFEKNFVQGCQIAFYKEILR